MSDSLLFIAADQREFTGFLTHWRHVEPLPLPVHWARSGQWKGREVYAVANGAGADRAFAAILLAPKSAAICNIGFCGALDDKLAVGDIVIGTRIDSNGRTWFPAVPAGAEAARGFVASIDHVAQTAAEKRNLQAAGASIVEMEAAGVARAAEDLNVPFYCIRAVSDLAGETFATDFNAALRPDGRFSTARLVMQLNLKELLRLRQRTEIASKKLGDFLAATDF
ncbi:MAG TPA: hypothetical protein VMI53_01165 [Opitutaceae bacterium]|nr:hypothetical protein [Opitutaceae bacterium]